MNHPDSEPGGDPPIPPRSAVQATEADELARAAQAEQLAREWESRAEGLHTPFEVDFPANDDEDDENVLHTGWKAFANDEDVDTGEGSMPSPRST